MLLALFCILMVAVFGRLLVFALRFTWSMLKGIGTLVFLPIALILMVAGGLIRLALPLLVIFGIISLFVEPTL